ncbi:MAG: hypothetical protein K9H48_07945 [Melioribacteraceae bacterium]|nr:hypothetical protein [Melioribacteraceae bacterium]
MKEKDVFLKCIVLILKLMVASQKKFSMELDDLVIYKIADIFRKAIENNNFLCRTIVGQSYIRDRILFRNKHTNQMRILLCKIDWCELKIDINIITNFCDFKSITFDELLDFLEIDRNYFLNILEREIFELI